MKPQPLIAVFDVAASSRWYQATLGFESGHGGDEYERLLFEGELVMQLHHWDAHEHPFIGDADKKPYGNGVVIWFQTQRIDQMYKRAQAAGAEIIEAIKINPSANHREFWLRDPDGYVVVVAGAYGDTLTESN